MARRDIIIAEAVAISNARFIYLLGRFFFSSLHDYALSGRSSARPTSEHGEAASLTLRNCLRLRLSPARSRALIEIAHSHVIACISCVSQFGTCAFANTRRIAGSRPRLRISAKIAVVASRADKKKTTPRSDHKVSPSCLRSTEIPPRALSEPKKLRFSVSASWAHAHSFVGSRYVASSLPLPHCSPNILKNSSNLS